jgi:hypothetical protein
MYYRGQCFLPCASHDRLHDATSRRNPLILLVVCRRISCVQGTCGDLEFRHIESNNKPCTTRAHAIELRNENEKLFTAVMVSDTSGQLDTFIGWCPCLSG